MSSSLATFLIDWLLHSTMLLSLVCAVLILGHQHILRRWGAGTTYMLWLLVPLVLVLPVLSTVTGAVLSSLSQGVIHSTPMASYSAFYSSPSTLITETKFADTWLYGALLGWFVPVAALLSVYGYHLLQVRRLTLSSYFGLPVRRADAGSSPALVGFLRPHLQLPIDFEHAYTPSQRRFMLAHELEHWRNGDLGYNALAWLCLALQWFNPLAWLAYRRFRADQELACDARVLRRQRNQTKLPHVCYANALLATLQCALTSAQPKGGFRSVICTQYGHQGDKSMYQERIQQLNKPRSTHLKPVVVTAATLSLIACAWLIPASAASSPAFASATQVAANVNNAEPAISPIVRINPRYPESAAAEGVEGHVDFQIVINRNGEVANIEVLDAQPEGVFEEAASEALQRWRFAPQDNVNHRLRIAFSLDSDA